MLSEKIQLIKSLKQSAENNYIILLDSIDECIIKFEKYKFRFYRCKYGQIKSNIIFD